MEVEEPMASVTPSLDEVNGQKQDWIEINGKRYYEVDPEVDESANTSQEDWAKLFLSDESDDESFSDEENKLDNILPEIISKQEIETLDDSNQEIGLLPDVASTSSGVRFVKRITYFRLRFVLLSYFFASGHN